MTYFTPRIAPSGSLTAGVPAAQYPAGSYAFRTSILVLALEPVVDNAAFVQSLADWTSRTISGRLRSGRISVGSPSRLEVPREDRESLGNILLTTTSAALVGAAFEPALIPAIVLASYWGWAIGAAGNYLIPDHVPARWVTIDGIIDSLTSPVTTAFVTQAIASALDATLRLRSPSAPYPIIQPNDAQVGASVIARTREDGACSGHRRLDKVIAAACTRLEPTAALPTAPQPTQQPQPSQRPPAVPPSYPQTTRPSPAPVVRPTVINQPQMPPASSDGVSPWVYAGIAVVVLGGAAYVLTKD